MSRLRRRAGVGAAASMAALLALVPTPPSATPWLLVNESSSLPRGLYVRRAQARVARGAIVAIPQPGVARAYLGRLGAPADLQLLKRVAAVGGDRVCASEAWVTAPTGSLAVSSLDRRGTPLKRWRGCGRLEADQIFLVGDTPSSFDSRYFGPVSLRSVTGVYAEVWRW